MCFLSLKQRSQTLKFKSFYNPTLGAVKHTQL